MTLTKIIVRSTAAVFTLAAFILFMLAMVTDHWRENDETVLTNPVVHRAVEMQLNISGYTWKSNHGLWWKCVNPPDDDFRTTTEAMVSRLTNQKLVLEDGCEKIVSSVDEDRNRRGNSIRTMVGSACIFSFLVLLVELCRCFCFKHEIAGFLSYFFSFMALLSGVIGMAIFTKYYSPCYKIPGDWREYGWSYYVGWSGCVLMFIPLQLYLADMFTRFGYYSEGKGDVHGNVHVLQNMK